MVQAWQVHGTGNAGAWNLHCEKGVFLGSYSIVARSFRHSVQEKGDCNSHIFAVKILAFKSLVQEKKMLKLDIGSYCSDPYPCDFTGY